MAKHTSKKLLSRISGQTARRSRRRRRTATKNEISAARIHSNVISVRATLSPAPIYNRSTRDSDKLIALYVPVRLAIATPPYIFFKSYFRPFYRRLFHTQLGLKASPTD